MNEPIPEAITAATSIAEKLGDPKPACLAGTGRRRPQSLAGGAAGIALLHIERASTGHGDWATARAWLSGAARDDLSVGRNANLFFGAPTLAFVTLAAACAAGGYARTLDQLDRATISLTQQRLDDAHARIDRGDRPLLAEFDLIRGLAGLGAYHLRRHAGHDVTLAVLTYLVRLTEPLPGDKLPGWWTTVAPHGAPSPNFPEGHGNLGMSHGVAAPLAVLATAMRHGVLVDGQADAITRICAWLDEWQQYHPAGTWWPGFITRDQVRAGRVDPNTRPRPSWCYGAAGLARAQQLAAIAIGDTERQRIAEAAMLACLQDPVQLRRMTASGLCHGIGGLLQAAWRMARDAITPDLAAQLPALTIRLLAQLRSTSDDVEFLDGLAGIAVTLHTVGTGITPAGPWDACLMLA